MNHKASAFGYAQINLGLAVCISADKTLFLLGKAIPYFGVNGIVHRKYGILFAAAIGIENKVVAVVAVGSSSDIDILVKVMSVKGIFFIFY